MRTLILIITGMSISAIALSQNLVAYYPFDSNPNDQSGHAINPTYIGKGVALTADRFGNANKAYNFNGAVGSYMRMPADLLPTTNRTISLWFNVTDVTNSPGLLGYGGNGSCGTTFFMGLNILGKSEYHVQGHCLNNMAAYVYSAPPVNNWYHWVVTINGTQQKIYINGQLKATSNTFSGNTIVAGKDFALGVITYVNGAAPYTDQNVGYLKGKLDDIRIYDNAMTAEQVQNLYNNDKTNLYNSDNTTNLVAYYPFDGNANDQSGHAINPTYIGKGVTLTADRFGNANKAYSFNGTVGSYIRMPADLLPTTNRTISLWFNVTNVTNRPGLLGYGGNGSCGTTFFMGLNILGKSEYHVQGHCLNNMAAYVYSAPPVNNWYHWVVTINGTQQKIYINGQLKATSNTFDGKTIVAGKDFALGVITYVNGTAPYTDPNVGYLKGKLDDIRIYDNAMTAEQVRVLYSNEAIKKE